MSLSEIISGYSRVLLVAGTGILLAVIFYLMEQPIIAGFAAIICGTLALGMMISIDAARHSHPIIIASLAENHREIILENTGTKSAENIQVTAAGTNDSWKIPSLEPDTITKVSLPALVTLVTVEVTYDRASGERRSKVFTLGSQDTRQDPFKPMFPLFGWKKE